MLAPLPNWICGRCANPDDFVESSGNAVVDFGRFCTGFLVLMGIGRLISFPWLLLVEGSGYGCCRVCRTLLGAELGKIAAQSQTCGLGWKGVMRGRMGIDAEVMRVHANILFLNSPPSSPRPLRNHPLVRSRDVHHRRCIDLRHHHRLRDVL
ncbi:MAG: hypothetical protein CL912_30900 [Deltaproteobacteria bacterium]|nr:hypothetical protein [Deltaproteobacteria bacterium]